MGQEQSSSKERSKQQEFFEKQKEKIEEPEEFQELVDTLRGELADHILKTINFDEIFQFSLTMIYEMLSGGFEFSNEDRTII